MATAALSPAILPPWLPGLGVLRSGHFFLRLQVAGAQYDRKYV